MEIKYFDKEFVERTKYIVQTQCKDEFTYDVTLLLNCLLGLVSLPTERTKPNSTLFKNECVNKLKSMGVIINSTDDDKTFRTVKNALSHMNIAPQNKDGVVDSTRVVPMTDDVYECFKRIIANRKKPKVEPMICGKSGFLYLDKNDMPMVALHWEKYFQHICEKYNSIYKVQMPKITPHVCRHTFCSNMAKSGMNPKTLQYIMGHSDIGVTLNTYTHIGFEDAQVELQRVANAE